MPLLNGSDEAILHVRLLGFCTSDHPLVFILLISVPFKDAVN